MLSKFRPVFLFYFPPSFYSRIAFMAVFIPALLLYILFTSLSLLEMKFLQKLPLVYNTLVWNDGRKERQEDYPTPAVYAADVHVHV